MPIILGGDNFEIDGDNPRSDLKESIARLKRIRKQIMEKVTNEKLYYDGLYAISEEEFDKEVKNFVVHDDGHTIKLTLEKNGETLCINYYKGDEKNGELPTLSAVNFEVLSKEPVDPFDDALRDLDCNEEEMAKIKARGFKSLVNIDFIGWREQFDMELNLKIMED